MQLRTLDDLQLPGPGLRGDGGHDRPLIAAVGVDDFDEGKQTTGSAQQFAGTVAILHASRMDHDVQEEAKRIDENVPLAARDLLARVEALRIDRRPPFCAALAL